MFLFSILRRSISTYQSFSDFYVIHFEQETYLGDPEKYDSISQATVPSEYVAQRIQELSIAYDCV